MRKTVQKCRYSKRQCVFPQTPYRGSAPGPRWGLPSPRPLACAVLKFPLKSPGFDTSVVFTSSLHAVTCGAAGDGKHDHTVQVPRRVWIVFDEDLLDGAGRHAQSGSTHLSALRRRRRSTITPSSRLQPATSTSGRAHRKN